MKYLRLTALLLSLAACNPKEQKATPTVINVKPIYPILQITPSPSPRAMDKKKTP
jgi:hypothetical protein